MSEVTERLEGLIGGRLAAIEVEAAELRRALAGLGEGSLPRHRRSSKSEVAVAPPKAGGPVRRKRQVAGRVPRGRRREELLAALAANPGARPSELARSMGVSASQVGALIAKARVEKLVVRRGAGYALKG